MIQRIRFIQANIENLKIYVKRNEKMVYINSSIHTIPTAIPDNIISTSFLK